MRARSVALTLVAGVLGAAVCLAADAQLGTWKLNEAKSKLNPGGGKNNTVVYSAAGDNVKVTVDGVDASGKAFHSEWTGKFDGKDYPVSGDPISDARSYTKVDDRTLRFTGKKGGAELLSGTISVSSDGKSRTVTVNATGADGKNVTTTAVYDKQ
jgi:hypothetical protein